MAQTANRSLMDIMVSKKVMGVNLTVTFMVSKQVFSLPSGHVSDIEHPSHFVGLFCHFIFIERKVLLHLV